MTDTHEKKLDGYYVCQYCGYAPPQWSPDYHDCVGRLKMIAESHRAEIDWLEARLELWAENEDGVKIHVGAHYGVYCRDETIRLLEDAINELKKRINTPQTEDWFDATRLEAAFQIQEHSKNSDAGKKPSDWYWLVGYLAGKALAAFILGDVKKGKHHIISTSAALLNWHRNVTGESTAMRPGIEPINQIEEKIE